jgi:hypothetical protein
MNFAKNVIRRASLIRTNIQIPVESSLRALFITIVIDPKREWPELRRVGAQISF